jgi:putative ABC transport system permease protein
MNLPAMALRGLRFHWRQHAGVLLGATLATAILVGALAVGDSVRYSLLQMALTRLGGVQVALNSQGQFFRDALASDLASDLKGSAAPVLNLRGTAASSSGEARVAGVKILGVDDRFWSLAPHPAKQPPGDSDSVTLSENLAHALGVKADDEVVLRVDKPSLLSRDAPLSTIEDSSVALRLRVSRVLSDAEFGRFSLSANQLPPFNALVPIKFLQGKLGVERRANLLLVGGKSPVSTQDATRALWSHWQLTDSSLQLAAVPNKQQVELRTDRVFLDPPVGDSAIKVLPGAKGVLTYFVNELRVGLRATPYSTVAAVDMDPVPAGMADDEIVINQWLADDLQAKPGDTVRLSYWTVGPMRKLIPMTADFRIRSVVPLVGPALDPALMPNIPGLADKKNCRDWEPGVPIDLHKIRDKDQAYWSAYRGTPKAFITLRAGQKIWDNRFGNLTAVRYPSGGNPAGARAQVETCLRQALSPAALGLFFTPVREMGLKASFQAIDFGQLFLGFSLFLIAAALILTALLFAFGAEQRGEESGTLLAVGWPPGKVRGLLLIEGALVAGIAAVFGSLLAVVYTRVVVAGLTSVWRGAVASSALQFYVDPATIAMGAVSSFIISLFSVWLVARKQARVPARELLSGSSAATTPVKRGAKRGDVAGLPTAIACIGAAFVTVFAAGSAGHESRSEYFFMAGALLLFGGVALCRYLLARLEKRIGGPLTVGSLGTRNMVRRRGRSLSAVGLLACGSFLIIAVGAFRTDPSDDAGRRSSGTGGFGLYGESSLPVYQDLNSAEGLDAYGLKPADLRGAVVVPFRLKEGDDASCLNLNRAQIPRLLGVNPDLLSRRKSFALGETWPGAGKSASWVILDAPLKGDEIPAIGDENTVTWSLGKSLGATLDYVDGRGSTRKLRIVGVMGNSVLQGGLIISEKNFLHLFPSQSGYQVFLVDAPKPASGQVSATLTKALEDTGLSLTPTADRLAAFSTVENTYLNIFAVLGGLGLLLGTFGLGVIVLRNVLERRGELALLRAVGFRTRMLQWMVFSEHALLLVLGLLVGVLAAIVAVLPALRNPAMDFPVLSLALTLAAVLAGGFGSTWLATTIAIRGPLLNALRNE